MTAKIYVTLKAGVLDPQGQAVQRALGRLGFEEVAGARLGKFIEWDCSSVHDSSQEQPSFFANGRERDPFQPLIEGSFRTRLLDRADVTKIFLPSQPDA